MDVRCFAAFTLFCFYHSVNSHLMIKEADLELTYTVTKYNHCIVDESRLQLYFERRLDDCITACALRPHCQALTYHPQFGASSMCELFQTEGSDNNVNRAGCVYIERKDITIQQSPCTVECDNGTTCNMETKLCENTECANLPNITDGKILGNLRAVGNKIRFECDVGKSTVREAVCQSDGTWTASSVNCVKPEDCKDLYDAGIHETGVYRIFPVGSGADGIKVRCDMDTPPGGWTIIQRRVDGRNFYKMWSDYKMGFGDLLGSYWLGNEHIWQLTSNKQYRLRIELTAQDGTVGYAEYDVFSIATETLQYALNIGGFHGNVGDSLAYHNGMKFSTADRDNDINPTSNCAIIYNAAWWYGACHQSNLNGLYMNNAWAMGIVWYAWKGHSESLAKTEMKIYPA